MKNFLLTFLICTFSAPLAYSNESKVATETKEKKKSSKRTKLGVDQSDFMPSANSFGGIVSYIASYDDLEQTDDKTVGHRVNAALTYSLNKSTSFYTSMGATHRSVDNKIIRDNTDEKFHRISNLNAGMVHTIPKPLRWIRRSSNTLNIGFPVSERSRIDEHILNVSGTNFMTTNSWNKLSLFNRVTANFLWNRLDFSLSNNDQINRDWVLINSFGVNYQVLPRLGIRFNVSTNHTRSLDGTWTESFGNNLSIFTNVNRFQIFASVINRSYPENERIDVTFIDEFRQLYTAGVTYAF